MATDFSRVRHDPLLDWAGVQLKQGGVLLDADANELVAVLDRRLRALASDVLGRATVSQTTPEAFRITVAAGQLQIGRGRMYVDGLLAENHGDGDAEFDALMEGSRFADPRTYADQPYLPLPPALPTVGRHLVYLDVWNREVTPLENPDLVESAVGVDTSSRLQTVWQVRVLAPDAGTSATCATPDGELSGWAALIAPSGGRLTTGTFEVPPIDDPCELPPTGGYRGLENQLYRVEIHDPGTPGGGATFKWSRENASVGSRVASFISATELELETLGRDDVLGFADGDWVEIIDDRREFAQLPGEMRRIDIPDPGNRRIVFSPALPATMLPAAFPDSTLPGERNLRVRRWDQRGKVFRTGAGGSTVQVQDLDAPGSTGLINVPAAGTELLLENGVTVQFSSVGTNGFRRGDWWVFAARTSDATVEALDAAAPRGIHHHYARLGIWDVGNGTVSDCRGPWPPDGGHDCSCTQCVSPASHASGQLTIQMAVDRVRDTGGTVCLQPGQYLLQEPVRVVGARSIAIRGQGPATIVAAPGAAFEIESSMAVAIEKLAVFSVGQQAAIQVHSVLGLALRELMVFVFGNSDIRNAAITLAGICAAVRICDNLILAPDGIRAEVEPRQGPGFALLGAVTIENNIFSCQRRGIALDGTVGHLWETRIGSNQFAVCRTLGLSATGLAFPGSSLHIDGNNFTIEGHGIACGISGSWLNDNRLHFQNQDDRVSDLDGIALVAGFDKAGSEQTHVLANQISGFSGAGVAIRAPVRDLIVKLNIVTSCGSGIVMSEDAESDAVSIENNHLRNIVGGNPDNNFGIVAGISVLRTEAATVAGNQIREVARTTQNRSLSAGVLISGVTRSRIHGNEISEIGPASDFAGGAAGILVRAPLDQTEIANNQVRRDDESNASGSTWLALMIQGGGTEFDVGDNRRTAPVTHSTGHSTVRVDERRTLVFGGNRAYFKSAALDFINPTAAAVRGSVATIIGNVLLARGGAAAVDARTTAEIMFNDNRCELFDDGQNPAVRLVSPVLVLNANRVRSRGKPTVQINAGDMTVVGNITTNGIAPLTAPWSALNINA